MKLKFYSVKSYFYSRARLGLFILLLSTFSCENGKDAVNPSHIELTQQEKESLMHDFSYALAKAIQDEPALRDFLKKESVKQFDGDYDVLYQLTKGIQIGDKDTFRDILARYIISSEKMASIDKNFLNLNIKVLGFETPVEDWDTQYFVPLVAVRSFNEEVATITAYDGQGEKVLLDSQVQPKQLTIVIEESERIKLRSLKTLKSDLQKSLSEIVPYSYETERGGVAVSSLPPDGRPPRDPSVDAWMQGDCPRTTPEAANLTKSFLKSIYIPKSAFDYASDTWTEGRLDITAKLLTVRGDSKALDELNVITQVYKEELVPRYDRYGNPQGYITLYGYDAWKRFGAILGKWDRTLNGDTWKIIFTEIDPGGQTITVKKSFSSNYEFGIKTTDSNKNIIGFNAGYKGAETGEVTYTKQDVDDMLGEQFIYYCDKIGTYQHYFTGSVYFTIALME